MGEVMYEAPGLPEPPHPEAQEPAIESHDYITIDGKEPEEEKSFFGSTQFLVIGIAGALITGLLAYGFLFA